MLSCLCTCSGDWQPFASTSPEAAAQHMACPYAAAYNITHALLPLILKAKRSASEGTSGKEGSAHVLNVTSAAAFTAWRGAASYGAARWAVSVDGATSKESGLNISGITTNESDSTLQFAFITSTARINLSSHASGHAVNCFNKGIALYLCTHTVA